MSRFILSQSSVSRPQFGPPKVAKPWFQRKRLPASVKYLRHSRVVRIAANQFSSSVALFRPCSQCCKETNRSWQGLTLFTIALVARKRLSGLIKAIFSFGLDLSSSLIWAVGSGVNAESSFYQRNEQLFAKSRLKHSWSGLWPDLGPELWRQCRGLILPKKRTFFTKSRPGHFGLDLGSVWPVLSDFQFWAWSGLWPDLGSWLWRQCRELIFPKKQTTFSKIKMPRFFGLDLGRCLLCFLSLFASFPPCSHCCKAVFVIICLIPASFAVLQGAGTDLVHYCGGGKETDRSWQGLALFPTTSMGRKLINHDRDWPCSLCVDGKATDRSPSHGIP